MHDERRRRLRRSPTRRHDDRLHAARKLAPPESAENGRASGGIRLYAWWSTDQNPLGEVPRRCTNHGCPCLPFRLPRRDRPARVPAAVPSSPSIARRNDWGKYIYGMFALIDSRPPGKFASNHLSKKLGGSSSTDSDLIPGNSRRSNAARDRENRLSRRLAFPARSAPSPQVFTGTQPFCLKVPPTAARCRVFTLSSRSVVGLRSVWFSCPEQKGRSDGEAIRFYRRWHGWPRHAESRGHPRDPRE